MALSPDERVLVANPGLELGLVWVLNHRGEPDIVLRATLETVGLIASMVCQLSPRTTG